MPVASPVADYAAQLTIATHPGSDSAPDVVRQYVRYGSSPRGAQAMILGAKVSALFSGRYNVAFSDIQAVVYPALRHRLILNFDAQAEGVTTDEVIGSVLEAVIPDES